MAGLRTLYRKSISHVIVALCLAAVLLALVPLALILFYVITQGVSAANRTIDVKRVAGYSDR